MKRTIARWFRRLRRRPWTPFDPDGNLRPELFTHEGWHMVGALKDGEERVAKAQRQLDAAQRRKREAYERFAAAGRDAGELLEKSWATMIFDGIAGTSPALPNAAGVAVRKASWWRRLLRRFGR